MQVNPIELQKSLKGMSYPASKQDLVQRAQDNGADDDIRSALDGLPDTQFDGPDDVSEALG